MMGSYSSISFVLNIPYLDIAPMGAAEYLGIFMLKNMCQSKELLIICSSGRLVNGINQLQNE